ncbi:hypothetical protein NAPIS_ORF00166 [Vairimorpha apis BRL 01]|uniref:Uncharacterized protein n=1 Tax=Vairimorpha apis BRL 01 TaxID=1037528 RepID=T0LD98_9MICR|nr:hypothetical protein NAPIS_ORF00166 [Vairimorpha apis BRL 01]
MNLEENLNTNFEKNLNINLENNLNSNLQKNLNINSEKTFNINLENNLNSNLQKNLNINSEKTFNINLENNLNSNLQNINYLQNNGNILTINDFISIILSIYAKFKEGYFILGEEDLLNSVFAFINANKFYNLSELENFSEIFCLGLTSKEKFIRDNFFKLFDGMLSRDIKLRYKKLLSLNWSLANEYYIPFIICRLLLDCLDDFTLSTFRLFECGSYIYSNFRNQEEKEYKFKLSYDGYNVFINNICDWKRAINKFKLENFREVLYEHLYFFRNSNMYILNNLKLDVTDCFENMFYMVSVLEKKEDFSLLFLKQINEGKNSHIKSDNYSMFFSNKKI